MAKNSARMCANDFGRFVGKPEAIHMREKSPSRRLTRYALGFSVALPGRPCILASTLFWWAGWHPARDPEGAPANRRAVRLAIGPQLARLPHKGFTRLWH
jgi:hypothetical protein